MGITIFILALVVFAYYYDTSNSTKSISPIVNTNTITYPSNIKCEHCKEPIRPTMQTIDTGTWDLICTKCNKIAYMHPNREERKEQIKSL